MNPTLPPRRLSVAPMLDWTDRHYRHMARQITKKTWLYTEMIHAGAIVYGDTGRFLRQAENDNPVALQLGGSEPALLAQAAAKAAPYGYDEINLNCGCPSPRVQKGAFGACLMREADLVADCLNAMQDAAPDTDITVKHRIGLDKETAYAPLRDFVGTLRDKTACRIFIVHARNAWLEGLSPKENRDIPPLRYDLVYQLKNDFPDLSITINGGIKTNAEIVQHLQCVDGVMVGREAYHNPLVMYDWDILCDSSRLPEARPIDYEALIASLYQYARNQIAQGVPMRHFCRHFLGLAHGHHGARIWRRMLSDAALLQQNRAELILNAYAAMQQSANDVAGVGSPDV